jgi:beta-lactamase regulating signal transducer with metallopeptidase domain/Tol biopolymer transport system component
MEAVMTYAQSFFGWLSQTTLIASLVICLILLIQRILGNKLGPRWCHALWLVLLVRMVLPWSPSSRLSLSNLIPSWQRQTQSQQSYGTVKVQKVSPSEQAVETTETITSQEPQSDLATEKSVAPRPRMIANAEDQSGSRLVLLRRILPILWLAGAIVIGAYLLISDLALWRIVKRDHPLVNQAMLELFEECKAQMGVQSLVVVVPSDQVKSPGLFGFVRPRLLLPRQMLDTATAEEMRYVFLHELAHLRRHDIYLGWLTSLLQVLHWFNPLVWFAFYRMRADRELACDALVLTRTGQDKSQEYGGAIVELVRRFSRCRPLPAMAGIIESKSQLKRRITMITKFRNKSYRFSPLAVILIVILAFISLPEAKRSKASEATTLQPVNQPKLTKIQIPNRIPWDIQLSPDGKSIAFVNEKKIWIMLRSSKLGPDYPGAPKQLDTAGVEADWCGFTWSADGRWFAFNGKKVNEGNQCIYVVSADGGKPKLAYKNNRDVRVVNYRMSLSPHGETLAFTSVDANELHIYTIPVNGGQPKKLVDARAREPVFSPDGKMIAYVEDKALGRAGGGLWVVPATGGTPRLVAEAGNASSPVWSPDGTMLAFADYNANKQIYIVQLTQNRNSEGKTITIGFPKGIRGVRRLAGWTPDNEIGVLFATQTEFALYTQPVQGGKATFITHGGYPVQPRWSPDGKQIYHTNETDAKSDDWRRAAIAYVPAEGGDVTTIPLDLEGKIRLWAYGTGNRISPNGKTIVFAGQKPQEGPKMMHIWTLPIEGGTPRQLTDAQLPFMDWYPCWSPDGRNIAFVRAKIPENWAVTGKANIYVISTEGGEPKKITSESDRVFDAGPVIWSPDGKLLAYFSRDKDDAGVGTLKVIPPEGGEPRVVARVEKIFANKEMAWSPDSKRIAYNAPDNKIKIVSLDDGRIEEIQPDLKDVNIYHLDWSPDGENLVFGGYTGGGPEFWMMENFLPKDIDK